MSFTFKNYPDKESWLKSRTSGIGASEISKVCDVSPSTVTFDNLLSFKSALEVFLSEYKNIQYTNNQKRDAVKTRTLLNKIKSTVDSLKKFVKKSVLSSYTEFENVIKEIFTLVDEVENPILEQINEIEGKEKEDKKKLVDELLLEISSTEGVKNIDEIEYSSSWLNASTTLEKSKDELKEEYKRVNEEEKRKSPYSISLFITPEKFDLLLSFMKENKISFKEESSQNLVTF